MKIRIYTMLLLGLLFAGCVNLDPVEDDLQMYALGSVEDRPSAKFPENPNEVVYIGRPDLPAYLSNALMLIRSSDGEVKQLPGVRWAEPLEEGVARALSEYIARADGPFVAGYYPWPRINRETKQIRVRFTELSFKDDGSIHVVAFWWIAKGQGMIDGGLFEPRDIAWTPGQPATIVTAFNQILEQLGQSITAKR